MSFLSKIFGSGVKEVVDGISGVIDQFHMSEEEKVKAKLEIERILQEDRMKLMENLQTELEAKERILIAELNQGDLYTKRARPSVVYGGLAFIFLNYVLLPLFMPEHKQLELPVEFWTAWGGIVATWSVGRSFEKRGIQNSLTKKITGSKSLSILDS